MPVTEVNVSSVRTCESDEDPMKSTLSVALQMRSSRNFCVDVTLLGTEEVTAWLVTNLQVLQHLVQQHHMDLLCSCLHVPSNPPRLSSHTPGVRI